MSARLRDSWRLNLPVSVMWLGLSGGALSPLAAQAQSLQAIFPSVVRVECRLPNGEGLVSTGFSWRDPMRVVTALHGVAGCQGLNVFSEVGEKRSPAVVERAHMESDLALLRLERGIDLKPLPSATGVPDVERDRFWVIGYPQGIRLLDTDEVRFSQGVRGPMATLAAFDSIQGVSDLFKGVQHPLKSATIFRVKSVLQPGQSGAPIIDSRGQVVAIVNGGMLKGYAALNWSMPAHLYLAQLAESTVPPPRTASPWASHFSSAVALETKTVAIPERPRSPGARPDAGDLRRLHTRSLADLEAMLRQKGRLKEDGGNITFIRDTLGAQEAARLRFDIWYDPGTGATFGVPSNLQLRWNPQLRTLEAVTSSGSANMFVGVQRLASFDQARTAGKRAFIEKLLPLARWKTSPATLQLNESPDIEYAQWADFFDGQDGRGQAVSLNLSVTVSGTDVLGYAVFGPKDIVKGLSPFDRALYLMMQYGAQEYSDFARQ